MSKEWSLDDPQIFSLVKALFLPIEATIIHRQEAQYQAEQEYLPHPREIAKLLHPLTPAEHALMDVFQLTTNSETGNNNYFLDQVALHRHNHPLEYDQAVSRTYSLISAAIKLGILPEILLQATDRYRLYLEERPLYHQPN